MKEFPKPPSSSTLSLKGQIVNLKKAQAWFIVVIVLFSVNLAHALDFDKEIRKQEKVIVSVRQGLTHRDKIEKEEVKEQKKQDFQIVLLPKGSRN